MDNCLFCKIANGEAEAVLVYDDEDVVAFNDIHPKAPVHILIVPKKHVISIAKMEKGDEYYVAKMAVAAKNIAEERGLVEGGYRLQLNVGRGGGGELIDHLHMHLIGGKKFED